MKKLLIPGIALLLIACGAPDKKAELEKLKKQKSEIETKISGVVVLWYPTINCFFSY